MTDPRDTYRQAAQALAQTGWLISFEELRLWFDAQAQEHGREEALARMAWMAGEGLGLFALAPALPSVPAAVARRGQMGYALDLVRVRSKTSVGQLHEVLVAPGCGEALVCDCPAWAYRSSCEHGALAELADAWWEAARVLMGRGYTASRIAQVFANTLRQEQGRAHPRPRVAAVQRMVRRAGVLSRAGLTLPRTLLDVEVVP